MDTSIATDDSVRFVIEGRTTPAAAITSEGWIAIINAILDQHRKHAKKYLRYTRVTGRVVEDAIEAGGGGTYISISTPPENIVYVAENGSLDASTRLLPIGQFGVVSKDSDPPSQASDSRAVWSSFEIEETYLFLTDKFEWVLLRRWVMRMPRISNKEFLFELITEKQLAELIGERTHWWLNIVKSLRRAASREIDKKEEHIQALSASVSGIDLILSRIRA